MEKGRRKKQDRIVGLYARR